jgi:hypothetical protein
MIPKHNLSQSFFKCSRHMSHNNNNFLDKCNVASNLSIPFMHKITKYHGNEAVKFKIDICGTRQGRECLV